MSEDQNQSSNTRARQSSKQKLDKVQTKKQNSKAKHTKRRLEGHDRNRNRNRNRSVSRQVHTGAMTGQRVQGRQRLNTQTLMTMRGTGEEREEGGSQVCKQRGGAQRNRPGGNKTTDRGETTGKTKRTHETWKKQNMKHNKT